MKVVCHASPRQFRDRAAARLLEADAERAKFPSALLDGLRIAVAIPVGELHGPHYP